MQRNAANFIEQNFVNGLVSEATALNFPENACTSASNVIFKETGEVSRRLGYNYELDYVARAVTRSQSAIVQYEWKAAGGNGDVIFIVSQIGGTLYFSRATANDSLSRGDHATTIALSTFTVAGAPDVASEPCGFSSGKGFLFVTHRYCEPFYVSYTGSTNTLTAAQITIKVRDFEGVEDSLANETRPGTLSDAHEYNLCNQGWAENQKNSSGTTVNPMDHYFTITAKYPSNAQQWWVMKSASEEFSPVSFADSFSVGNTAAPKGHYILTWFNTDRSGADTRIGTATERTASFYRPRTTAFFAGRVWYAGVDFGEYTGEIYFTQIIERTEQLGQCYQANDPTSEILSDLLDSDGGLVRVLDIGTVHKLFATQRALLVFASNGVWSISGSDVTSFKASDYSIKKISSVSVPSGLSFVDVLGSPIFWTEEGIWTVTYEGGDFQVVSISDKKIKQYFNDIPRSSKAYAKGAFNTSERIVQWLFSSTQPGTIDERYNYDSILVLNTITGAFYPWTISSTTKKVNGIITAISPAYSAVVDISGNVVVDGSGNAVIAVTGSEPARFKYFVTKNVAGSTYNSYWALAWNSAYLDWAEDGENYDFPSTFISGYRVHADGNKDFQSNYVTFVCTDETGSSAFAQAVWDYSNSNSSKKWSTAQQVYNSTPTFRDYRIRKIKMRGWGKSLQFRITSATGLPFNIVGWSVFETANALP